MCVHGRSLRRGSKDAGTSKKSSTEKANGGEKGRVAAVQEEVGQIKTRPKGKTEAFLSQKMSRPWLSVLGDNGKLWATLSKM